MTNKCEFEHQPSNHPSNLSFNKIRLLPLLFCDLFSKVGVELFWGTKKRLEWLKYRIGKNKNQN